jgi:hypothetical protein
MKISKGLKVLTLVVVAGCVGLSGGARAGDKAGAALDIISGFLDLAIEAQQAEIDAAEEAAEQQPPMSKAEMRKFSDEWAATMTPKCGRLYRKCAREDTAACDKWVKDCGTPQ